MPALAQEANGKAATMGPARNGSTLKQQPADEMATSNDEGLSDDERSCGGGGGVCDSPTGTGRTTGAEGAAGTATVPTSVAVPPDGGWGWVVVAASFCCNLVVDGIIFSFGMLSPAIGETFGESKAKVALIGSLLSGAYLVAGPFASALANRYGFRSVTIVGAVLAGIAFLAASYASNIQFLYLTYGVVGGIGFGLIFVPAVITIGFYFEKWRALATGIAVCGSGIGTFVLAPLTKWLIKNYTWQQALLIQSGLILQCGIFGMLFRPLEHMQLQVPVNETTTTKDATKEKRLPLLLKTKLLRDQKGRSVSSISIYEDVGLTVEQNGHQHANDTYFSGNNANYPTASQMLQVVPDRCDKRSVESLHSRGRSRSRVRNNGAADVHSDTAASSTDDEAAAVFRQTRAHPSGNGKPAALGSCEINSIPRGSPLPGARTRNKSVSPLPEKRLSLVLETKSVRDRKYSLQPATARSQTFDNTNGALANGTKGQMHRRHTDVGNRPLYRDDIFFNSNLRRLSQYNSQTSSLNYTMSVTRLPTYNDLLEEKKAKFTILPEAMRRTLATMLDLSLLKSITFLVYALSGFFTAMGMYTPFLFATERAEKMNSQGAEYLMPVLGIANTIGRVGFGVISSIPRTNAILINNISLTLCGICTAISGLSPSPLYQFGNVCLFGATLACFSSLRTIIVVELLGLEKLTNAFGLLLLFQGVGAIMGPPLAGFLVDIKDDYDYSFYVSGAFILISAIICYPIEAISKWEKNHKKMHTKLQNK